MAGQSTALMLGIETDRKEEHALLRDTHHLLTTQAICSDLTLSTMLLKQMEA